MPSLRPSYPQTIDFDIAPTTLGLMLIACTDKGICSLCISDSESELLDELASHFPHTHLNRDKTKLAQAFSTLTQFLAHPQVHPNCALDIYGTVFQQSVWQALSKIPLGETLSYSALAARIGNPKAVRAVANACGSNKISLLIPCHRILGKNGKLTGYRWGIARKETLLRMERHAKIAAY